MTFRVLASKWRHILIMMEMGTTNKECKIRAELRVFKSIKDSLPTILDCGINPNNNNNIILTTLEQASTNKKNQSNTHHTKRLNSAKTKLQCDNKNVISSSILNSLPR